MPPALSSYGSSSEDELSYSTLPTSSTSPKVTKTKSLTSLDSRRFDDSTPVSTQFEDSGVSSQQFTPALSAGKKRSIREANPDDDEPDDNEEHTAPKSRKRSRRTSSKPVPKNRRHPVLLSGIDTANVLDNSSASPARSNEPPAYHTRARCQEDPKKRLCYSSKYHPMDQVTYPSRAARVMQELGIQDAGGDMAFSIAEDNDMEVDQENMAPSHEQESSFQGRVRRVLRPLNRQPLYDMTLHPQDDALAELEDGSMPASDFEIYVDDDEDQENGAGDGAFDWNMTTNQYLHFFGYDDEDMEDDRWESDGSNDSDKENVDPDHAVHSPAVPHGLLPSALPPVPRRDRPRRVAPPPEFEIYEPTAAEEAAALAEHYEVEYEHDDIENQHSGPAPCLLPGAHRVSSDSIMGPVSPNRTASLSSSDNE